MNPPKGVKTGEYSTQSHVQACSQSGTSGYLIYNFPLSKIEGLDFLLD